MNNIQDIPVWVLNLERDAERRCFIQQQLEGLATDYEIINAVDKERLTVNDLKHYSADATRQAIGRELTAGEIGCALSHGKLWERMLQERHPAALILEDDVRVGHALFHVLNNRHQFPPTLEFINLSTDAAQKPVGEYIADIYRLSIHQEDPESTCAYFITDRGARKLLSKLYPIWCPIDELAARRDVTGLVSYGIYPKVAVIGHDFTSSIGDEERDAVRNQKLSPSDRLWQKLQTDRESVKQIWHIIRHGPIRY